MRIHSILRKIRTFSLVGVTVLSCSVIVAGAATSKDLNDAKSKKTDLQNDINATQQILDQLAKDKTDAQSYIQAIDKEITDVTSKISDLNANIDKKNQEIIQNQALLETAIEDSNQQYESMKLRIRYMYEHESENYIEVLLASKNMADMLNKAEYISKITDYDRGMLKRYEQTQKTIQTTQVSLLQNQNELQESLDSVEREKGSLQLIEDGKEKQLKELNAKSDKTNANLNQLHEDAKAQEAEIQSIEAAIKKQEDAARVAAAAAQAKSEATGKTGSGSSQTTSSNTGTPKYNGGKFAWPVPASTRITSDYGDREDRDAPHTGLDIGASTPRVSGDKIVAAYDGTVVLAQYSSTAGNWININHGDGLLTVYMHASKLLVSVGDKVTKGQVIALMGSTGDSKGAHLHFGVRLNGVYVNPWNYLK